MTWNYRILRHGDGRLAVHVVFYDDDARPVFYTEGPITFEAEGDKPASALIDQLADALRDVRKHPVLQASDIGKGSQ